MSKDCKNQDLKGKVYNNTDLEHYVFIGANLSKAKFINTSFTGGNLTGVDAPFIEVENSTLSSSSFAYSNFMNSKFDDKCTIKNTLIVTGVIAINSEGFLEKLTEKQKKEVISEKKELIKIAIQGINNSNHDMLKLKYPAPYRSALLQLGEKDLAYQVLEVYGEKALTHEDKENNVPIPQRKPNWQEKMKNQRVGKQVGCSIL